MLGILGGVFDPPHVGHVALARAAIGHFELERLLVLVVADPGHKLAETPAATRLELARLAFADVPGAEAQLDRHARTVDSLEERKPDDAATSSPTFRAGRIPPASSSWFGSALRCGRASPTNECARRSHVSQRPTASRSSRWRRCRFPRLTCENVSSEASPSTALFPRRSPSSSGGWASIPELRATLRRTDKGPTGI